METRSARERRREYHPLRLPLSRSLSLSLRDSLAGERRTREKGGSLSLQPSLVPARERERSPLAPDKRGEERMGRSHIDHATSVNERRPAA